MNKSHKEAIGRFQFKGGVWNGLWVYFMGFCASVDDPDIVKGLYTITDYFGGCEVLNNWINWDTIVWYDKNEQKRLEDMRRE